MKKTILSSIVTCCSIFVASNSHAALRVLDFDLDANGNAIQNGQIIDDEYSSWGVQISGCNINGAVSSGTDQINGICADDGGDKAQRQTTFDTSLENTADPDLEFFNNGTQYESREGTDSVKKFYDPLSERKEFYEDLYSDERRETYKKPGNVLIIHENNTCNGNECSNPDDEGTRPAGFFVFEFTNNPVDILSLDFFDVEVTESQFGQPATKLYFFLTNNTVREADVPGIGHGHYQRENYSNMFGVTKLVVNMPGSGAINNLVFRDSTPQSAEVNAPAALAFLLIGFGFIYLRRR
ncbi:hypothetical protein [Agaribacter flavus]|uniref:Uncharacterized protein n=1 Tax=Agaribacter flavus TaxID=1902781 RepID=A0ABV7FPM7_9ALTE